MPTIYWEHVEFPAEDPAEGVAEQLLALLLAQVQPPADVAARLGAARFDWQLPFQELGGVMWPPVCDGRRHHAGCQPAADVQLAISGTFASRDEAAQVAAKAGLLMLVWRGHHFASGGAGADVFWRWSWGSAPDDLRLRVLGQVPLAGPQPHPRTDDSEIAVLARAIAEARLRDPETPEGAAVVAALESATSFIDSYVSRITFACVNASLAAAIALTQRQQAPQQLVPPQQVNLDVAEAVEAAAGPLVERQRRAAGPRNQQGRARARWVRVKGGRIRRTRQ